MEALEGILPEPGNPATFEVFLPSHGISLNEFWVMIWAGTRLFEICGQRGERFEQIWEAAHPNYSPVQPKEAQTPPPCLKIRHASR